MKGYVLGNVSKDKASRHRKAEKIVKILDGHKKLKGTKVLDIGTGAGYIAHALSKQAKDVHSVDIVDDRLIKEGYKHKIVKDETLPYPDKAFDVVVSNQVLEHVPDQHKHLSEIRRVLKDDGIVYLASPNKWWLTDPHYKLPFISWLPRPVAGQYLKLAKGRKWDIYSVSLARLNRLAKQQGFRVHDKIWDVMANPKDYQVNVPKPVVVVARMTPRPAAKVLVHAVPTHVKILTVR